MAAQHQSGLRRFLFENSVFLIAGAVIALLWANIPVPGAYASYLEFLDTRLFPGGEAHHGAHDSGGGHRLFPVRLHHSFTLKVIIDDVLMAFFFAIAGKEVWEALLPGGPLSNPRKAAMPLLAPHGGKVGPASLYLLGCGITAEMDHLGRGWAVPMATDIAFSYLVARFIFGPGHVAIPFLLLLAIADDAGGLIVLATAYPQHTIHAEWLALTLVAVLGGFALRRLRLQSFWWYLAIPGTLSWFSFYQVGIHPALGLLPIIPTLPHAHTDLGLFARNELEREDTLNEFEHWFKNPVEIILGLFGLVNAGVLFSSMGTGTWLVVISLLIGKPLGISFFGWLGERLFGLQLPQGMNHRHLLVVGLVAGIGFTVALFVAGVAFKQGHPAQDAVKMGALLSFAAVPLSILGARLLGVRAQGAPDDPADESSQDGPQNPS